MIGFIRAKLDTREMNLNNTNENIGNKMDIRYIEVVKCRG